jgi:acetyl-CoA acetyltransferase
MTVSFQTAPDTAALALAATAESDTPYRSVPTVGRFAGRAGVHRSHTNFENKSVISGVGRSAPGVDLGAGSAGLAAEACQAAITDAGLRGTDIGAFLLTADPAGSRQDTTNLLASPHRLGMPHAHLLPQRTIGPTGSLVDAMMLVARGVHQHVVCLTVFRALDSGLTVPPAPASSGPTDPMSGLDRAARRASRYLAESGASREAFGWVAVAARRHAARNPDALCRVPLDIDTYLNAVTLAEPFGPYDCDLPCDGAIALIVSSRLRAHDLAQPPIWVDAVGVASRRDPRHLLRTGGGPRSAAEALWARASLTREHVDFVSIDDSYSFNALAWLEALGFCGKGEAPEFVEGAVRIGPDGVLPLNPDGGQLAAGHSNGFSHVHEAVVQLRGQADTHQIPSVRVAAVSTGRPSSGNTMLLANEVPD